jgi:hypothetical protein
LRLSTPQPHQPLRARGSGSHSTSDLALLRDELSAARGTTPGQHPGNRTRRTALQWIAIERATRIVVNASEQRPVALLLRCA